MLTIASGCASTPSWRDPSRFVVVTVADVGGMQMPARGYHPPGYRLSEGTEKALAGLAQDYGLKRVDGWPIDLLGVYCAVMAVAADASVDDTLAQIGRDPRVRLSQPLQTFAVYGYNDPYFAVQYDVGAPQLLEMHRRATGRGIHVAIIDTGVDRAHPDLEGRIAIARNFVHGDHGFDADIHGTAVAGIIAADADNGVGIVGLAPGAELFALKACWQNGVDDIRAQCNTFTLAKALTFAIEQRADVINLSLGGPYDPLLAVLVRVALERGSVVVAARNAPDEFPADMPGVIAVHATDPDGALAPTDASDHAVIDVAARALLSTSPGGRYDYFSGSSMAAARVAGLAALLRQEHSSATSRDFRSELDRRVAELGARRDGTDRIVTRAPGTTASAPPKGILPQSIPSPIHVDTARLKGT
jgi:subtilisin family serine protease